MYVYLLRQAKSIIVLSTDYSILLVFEVAWVKEAVIYLLLSLLLLQIQKDVFSIRN